MKPYCLYGNMFRIRLNAFLFYILCRLQLSMGEYEDLCNICSKEVQDMDHVCDLRTAQQSRRITSTTHENLPLNLVKASKEAKKFECEICQKAFAAQCSLNLHTRIHNNERCYRCDLCNKSFRQKAHLSYHLQTHFKKKIQCNECQELFDKKSYLEAHKRKSHPGPKPFICEICSKKFVRQRNLSDHYRLHSGNLYSCQLCTRSYTTSATLKRHQKDIHHYSSKKKGS